MRVGAGVSSILWDGRRRDGIARGTNTNAPWAPLVLRAVGRPFVAGRPRSGRDRRLRVPGRRRKRVHARRTGRGGGVRPVPRRQRQRGAGRGRRGGDPQRDRQCRRSIPLRASDRRGLLCPAAGADRRRGQLGPNDQQPDHDQRRRRSGYARTDHRRIRDLANRHGRDARGHHQRLGLGRGRSVGRRTRHFGDAGCRGHRGFRHVVRRFGNSCDRLRLQRPRPVSSRLGQRGQERLGLEFYRIARQRQRSRSDRRRRLLVFRIGRRGGQARGHCKGYRLHRRRQLLASHGIAERRWFGKRAVVVGFGLCSRRRRGGRFHQRRCRGTAGGDRCDRPGRPVHGLPHGGHEDLSRPLQQSADRRPVAGHDHQLSQR